MLKSWPPASQNGTLFGDEVFKEIMKLKPGQQGELNTVLIRTGDYDMDAQRPGDGRL